MLVRRVWPSRPTFDGSFAEVDQLRREMMRLLDTAVGDAFDETGVGVFPPISITQDDDNFYVRAQIPGTRPDQLSISAQKNRISLSGSREIPREHDRVSYHRRERAEGSFNRTLTLPTEFDTERVEARYTAGILTLTLPKAEETKPRQITVRT